MKQKFPSIFLTLVAVLSTFLFPSRVILSQSTLPQIPSETNPMNLSNNQIRDLQKRSAVVRGVVEMFRQSEVGIDAFLLFSKNWKILLRETFGQIPDMRVDRSITTNELQGLFIANRLYLPDNVRLTGDTVILANEVRFGGNSVNIKGPHAIHFFVVNAMETANGGGPVLIDTSGRGRREVEAKAGKQKTSSRLIGKTNESYSFSEESSHSIQDESGQPGADGANGQNGISGSHGSNGSNGRNGTCHGGLNGGNGSNGVNGTWGSNAGDGLAGGNGENGGSITLNVTDMNAIYTVISRGGNGGNGGNGGIGGNGGNGGNGGKGASCDCSSLGVGGNGGGGGDGGYGGDGGDGGNGGNGGEGGQISINYPHGFNLNQISHDVGGGLAGQAGQGGMGGLSGVAGSGGTGGAGGSVFSCTSNSGIDGNSGMALSPGNGGDGGSGGNGGGSGNVLFVPVGGGGGNLEPGSYGNGCTNWFWVYYTCYEQRPRSIRSTNLFQDGVCKTKSLITYANFSTNANGTFPVAPSKIRLGFDWQCQVTGMQWAGCW
jgi:hypothetical protein